MIIYVSFFGDHISSALIRVRQFFDGVEKLGEQPEARYILLTDNITVACLYQQLTMPAGKNEPNQVLRREVHVVEPDPILIRAANENDRHSANIVALLRQAPEEPFVVVHPSMRPQKHTWFAMFAPLLGQPLVTLDAPIGTRVPWMTKSGQILLQERSADVLAFLAPTAAYREALAEDYVKAWHWLDQHDSHNAYTRTNRASRAWSLVNYWCEGSVLPYSLFDTNEGIF